MPWQLTHVWAPLTRAAISLTTSARLAAITSFSLTLAKEVCPSPGVGDVGDARLDVGGHSLLTLSLLIFF